MAKLVVNPEAELLPRAGDIDLELSELASLEVFSSIKKLPAFEKFPGTTKLRHYFPGEVICHQGRSGKSAFYLLTLEDLRNLSGEGSIENKEDPSPEAVVASRPVKNQLKQVKSLYKKINPMPTGGSGSPPKPRKLASATLLRDSKNDPITNASFWARTLGKFGKSALRTESANLQSIPNDGPTDIDYESGEAAILEGEVFGEMSCLTRQPRSATVVAVEECFAMEFLRNVLDQMRRDPLYKKRSDEKYRERVMEGHVRNLSIFRSLSSEQFREKANRIELVDLEPGKILFDEEDPSDAVYVVRSGILKVVQSYPWRLDSDSIHDWENFLEAIQAGCSGEGMLAFLSKSWTDEIKQQAAAADQSTTQQFKDLVIREFNELAKTSKLLLDKQLQSVRDNPTYLRETSSFGSKPKKWGDLEIRRANRVLFHLLMPEVISSPEPLGVSRVLSYVGRGSTVGEIGLVLKENRSATCIAHAHQGFESEATNVELLRISAKLFKEIVDQSAEVRREMKRVIQDRMQNSLSPAKKTIPESTSTRLAEELGLLQGQKLMLIDLDRCTRCGDCVEACVATHDDGYSRLYLDGPRYGNYLVPSSCRNCRDPVCMIGCPVGSIQQGDQGEVLIRDWCIGCGVCARQCPYDALQMHDQSLLPSGAPGWKWFSSNIHVGEKWAQCNFSDRHWQVGATPVTTGIALELISQQEKPSNDFVLPERYYFRYRLTIDPAQQTSDRNFRLLLTACGGNAHAFLDGQRLELSQDKRQEKNGVFQAVIAPEFLTAGTHLLAASVQSSNQAQGILFDAQLDQLPLEEEETEEKLVSERAVVCDQCSTLSGDRHACVYACPHEAAMRIDGWIDLPTA